MKSIKDELQNIILGDESAGQANKLKKVQSFLRSNAATGLTAKEQQHIKSKETAVLLTFADRENLFYKPAIQQSDFISEGAEQKVYRLNGTHIIKTNGNISTKVGLIISIA